MVVLIFCSCSLILQSHSSPGILVSMLIVLILMIRGNEMIVARTSGISTLSLMKPFVGFSLVLVLVSFALAEWIVPLSANASNYIYQVKIRGEESHVFIKNDRIWFKRDQTICNIDFFDTKKDIIKGLRSLTGQRFRCDQKN